MTLIKRYVLIDFFHGAVSKSIMCECGISLSYSHSFLGCSNVFIEGSQITNSNLALKFVFVLAKSVEPDNMPHYAAFHQGLHWLT